MPNTKRAVFTATLPPTPVEPGMRESMLRVARQENKSLAEIQRTAFIFFLRRDDRKTIIDDPKNSNKTDTQEVYAAVLSETEAEAS